MNPHWMLIDASFCAHHAFYGSAQRDPVTAVLLAITDAERYSRQFNPTGIVFAFDSKPYHRTTIYPDYKKRPQTKLDDEALEALDDLKTQITKLHDYYLPALGYRNMFRQKGYEADDVIAKTVFSAPKDVRFTVVSRDHDLYQLLSPRTSIYDPVSTRTLTHDAFRKEHGIHPSEWIEVKAMAGCNSDAIAGIDGVGEATAMKWMRGEVVGGKRCKAIREFRESPEYQTNLKLVGLPYDGMEPITPLRDAPQPPGAWRSLTESLERPGLGSSTDDNRQWRRHSG